jgi:hypothetical protein
MKIVRKHARGWATRLETHSSFAIISGGCCPVLVAIKIRVLSDNLSRRLRVQ